MPAATETSYRSGAELSATPSFAKTTFSGAGTRQTKRSRLVERRLRLTRLLKGS